MKIYQWCHYLILTLTLLFFFYKLQIVRTTACAISFIGSLNTGEKMLSSAWSTCCSGISQRWIFVLLSFFGLWMGNGLRVVLSITITEMVLPVQEHASHIDDTCVGVVHHVRRNLTLNSSGIYDWDEYTQGIILSSYFWGYAAMQFSFGTLAERFGGKYLFGLGIFIPSILTFLIPMAVDWGGFSSLIALRVMMGATSGTMYPAVSAMISKWTLPNERTKFGSIIFAGAVIGTVFGTTMPAVIIRYSGMGWPLVFHVFGIIGAIWFLFWMLFSSNSPEDHPLISQVELKYLQEGTEKKASKSTAVPWRHILTSMPFWAFVMALVGSDWAYFTIASDLPKYMSSVVKFSIEDNGYLSSLPYMCMWLNSIFSSWAINQLLSRDIMSQTNVRKLFATVALMGPALFIVGASYAECNQALVVVMFIAGMALMGSIYPSIMVNAHDLSPNYAGTLMAIGNGIAAVGGVLTPYIVGVLAPNQTIGEWRLVFWIVLGIAVLADAFFLYFGSGKIQKWDDPDFQRLEEKKEASKQDTIKNITNEESV